MENKTIKVIIKNVYGTNRIYAGCETALLFLKIAKQKTFNNSDIMAIRDLGYTIEQITAENPIFLGLSNRHNF